MRVKRILINLQGNDYYLISEASGRSPRVFACYSAYSNMPEIKIDKFIGSLALGKGRVRVLDKNARIAQTNKDGGLVDISGEFKEISDLEI